MNIHFYVRFHTEPGQYLQVYTNLKASGSAQGNIHDMDYLNNEFWKLSLPVDPTEDSTCRYAYQLVTKDGEAVKEWGDDRIIEIDKTDPDDIQVIDTWNHAGEYENAFYTAPFIQVLLPKHAHKKGKPAKKHSHTFKVKAPLLHKNEVICMMGSGPSLGEWNTDDPILFHLSGNWWTAHFDLPKEGFPLTYKYGVYNTKSNSFVRFEQGNNRSLFGDAPRHQQTIVHDGFAYLENNTWKGAGLAIPVFSLRTKRSFGIGEFTDLEVLADWASSVDMKLIQILPINDTTATNTWTDSYPYAAISAFALHPIYVNVSEAAGKKHADLLKPFKQKQRELNALPVVDYEQVLSSKLDIMRQLYELQKSDFESDKAYTEFFDQNKYWLIPYAAFCYLRDKHGSADFTKWKQHRVYDQQSIEKFVSPSLKHHDQIRFHYFLQYHLHRQLKAATTYAHKQGIIVKGDIPIGIYRYSCDAWMAPDLYHMDQQAGAPPDDFAIKGQNWGFPTYNWAKMQEDGFSWWKQRFAQMSAYFDAFRIDHILGFFRIWSIPLDSVEGIMGHFSPALPVAASEFQQRNIWFDYNRYTKPYITEQMIWEKFGSLTLGVKNTFLEPTGYGQYNFLEAFDTQRKIETWFNQQEASAENDLIRQGLYDLHSNVILFEVEGSGRQLFHFRFGIESTASFQALEWDTKQGLKELYVNYFFRRQDGFWMKEALEKLPALKASTNMLICGEDLGMVPACVPDVMKQLGILSLEIQRMPKDPAREFFHPNDAPYLSVVTPSTHDMSTIRGWWEEDREKTQRFFNHELGQWGEAPIYCEAWINKSIVIQHLYSPAMWSIFQLQDLFGIDEKIRRANAAEERINIPSVSRHYWQYRMHLTLEELMEEKSFNHELREYIKASGRD